jgi:hypothetical protein
MEWIEIPGYERIYQAASTGKIRRIGKASGATALKELKPFLQNGYCFVCLSINRKIKRKSVHSLVMLSFKGPVPDRHEINHIDGNKSNNNIKNLEYVTRSQNRWHSVNILGEKIVSGERHGMSKLDKNKVKNMRKFRQAGLTYKKIADLFSIDYQTAWSAINSRTWCHVK